MSVIWSRQIIWIYVKWRKTADMFDEIALFLRDIYLKMKCTDTK